MVNAVHVNWTIIIFKFVEWTSSIVVARRVAGQRRADNQRQRLWIL